MGVFRNKIHGGGLTKYREYSIMIYMERQAKMHLMRLAREPFGMIASGRKTVEVRLFDEKRGRLSVGDTIEFTCTDSGERITVRITDLMRFSSFSELYSSGLLDDCGCGGMTVEEAVSYILRYYTASDEAKYGALAVRFEVVS